MSLCKSQFFVHFQNFSPTAYKNENNRYKEASFYTCQKASLTVEAVVVIPMATAFLLAIMSFFCILQVQVKVEEALVYAGRKVAVESSVVEEPLLQAATAKALVMSELGKEPLIERYVKGDAAGVVILLSSFEGDTIVLHATYGIELPIPFFGKYEMILWSRNSFRKWIGNGSSEGGEDDGYVYITPDGEVYHKLESCRSLNLRIRQCFFNDIYMLRGESGQKYYACSCCAEEIAKEGIVYYTDYGNRYHQRLQCKYLKRTIEKVPLAEVSDRRPCKLCSGGNE